MTTTNNRPRRIASHQTVSEDGSTLTLHVVEIRCARVTALYPLTQELPFTEWFSGTIVLRRDEGGVLRAYYKEKLLT